ncbi:MAG: Crp/Fnr family transcriptional regulator [Bacteroidota bacterium]
MFDTVKKNLSNLSLSPEELTTFLSFLTTKTIKKYDFFLKEGEVCNHVAFVNKGLVRFYFMKDGKEHVSDFKLTGEWISNYGSFLSKEKSLFYIDAMEDTELYLLSYSDIQKMYDLGKTYERIGRLMVEQVFLRTINRHVSMLIHNPEERYVKLLEEKPYLFERVPLKQIASMLGIEPESLSRIRKRVVNQNKSLT